MQQQEFEKLFAEAVEQMSKLLVVKGGEYAGSSDRLGNFKRGTARTGCTPLQTLWVYAAKHIDSIETFIKDDAAGADRVRSEPIEGRIHDLMNYCVLLLALIQDGRKPTEMEVKLAEQQRQMMNYNVTRAGDIVATPGGPYSLHPFNRG